MTLGTYWCGGVRETGRMGGNLGWLAPHRRRFLGLGKHGVPQGTGRTRRGALVLPISIDSERVFGCSQRLFRVSHLASTNNVVLCQYGVGDKGGERRYGVKDDGGGNI
jgi:hypothetical protein